MEAQDLTAPTGSDKGRRRGLRNNNRFTSLEFGETFVEAFQAIRAQNTDHAVQLFQSLGLIGALIAKVPKLVFEREEEGDIKNEAEQGQEGDRNYSDRNDVIEVHGYDLS